MYIFLVSLHVIAMVLSISLMSGALVLGLLGKNLAVRVASFGAFATFVGFISGALLMIGTPLDFKCVMLTTYVIGVSVLYYFGYGFGDSTHARLVRGTA